MNKELAEKMVAAVKGYVERVAKTLSNEFEKRIAQIPAGERGEPGEVGSKGEPGPAGLSGAHGEKGLDGRDGKDGKDGRDGSDGIGVDGRDALDIEILPAIDETKRYPRGTWASHNGGLWKAVTNTEVMRGWECIWDGFPKVEMVQSDDMRTMTFRVHRSTGELVEQTFSIPAMIYREVYRPSTEYKRGDVVTWGGSAWHCQADKTETKPGTNEEWKMMVKEGRPGKDGKDGTKGDPGTPGPRGKDLTQLSYDGSKH